MKTLTSFLLGATALTMASFGLAQPAQARSDFGVYLSPYGLRINVDHDRDYCRDYWYRRNHPYRCNRHYDNDYGQSYYNYSQYDYRGYDNDDRRYRHRDRDDWGRDQDWGRHNDHGDDDRRGDRGDGERHRGDGGEGDNHRHW